MIAFYKHLIATSTEMLVISKAAAPRDRKNTNQTNTKKPEDNHCPYTKQ